MGVRTKRRLVQLAIVVAVICVLAGGVWLWRSVRAGQAEARLWEVTIAIPEGASKVTQTVRGGVRDIRFEFSGDGANQPVLEFYQNELEKTGWQSHAVPWIASPGRWFEGPLVIGETGRTSDGSLTQTGDVMRSYQYLWWHQQHDLLAQLVVQDTSGWRDELSEAASSAGLVVTLLLLDRAWMERRMSPADAGSGPRAPR